MSTIGPRVVVVGELHADEDIVIEGRVEGSIVCEQASVAIRKSGEMRGDIIARDITVEGRVAGRLIARGLVDVTRDAQVTGPVMAPRFVLADGALFSGRVEPQHCPNGFLGGSTSIRRRFIRVR